MRLVTGRAAFEGDTASDVIAEILKAEPPPPVEFAPECAALKSSASSAKRCARTARLDTRRSRDLLIDLQDFKKEAEFQAKLQATCGTAAGTGDDGDRIAQRRRARYLRPMPRIRGFYARKVARGTCGGIVDRVCHHRLLLYQESDKPRHIGAARAAWQFSPSEISSRILRLIFLDSRWRMRSSPNLAMSTLLRFVPRLPSTNIAIRSIDPKQVAADLNVDTLLTGSFIKDGDDLRITTQLIDVKPDKILWREAIDLKYDKLLTVQDRVSQQIIKELELNLSPAEAANLKPEKPISTARLRILPARNRSLLAE